MTIHDEARDFDMSSWYHPECFVLPKKYREMGVADFVTDLITDTSDDNSILPAQSEKIIAALEEAQTKKRKATPKKNSGEAQPETLIGRVAKVAKEELALEGKGNPPPKKKAKKGDADEKEFAEMVDLYKDYYKLKVDELKDFLR